MDQDRIALRISFAIILALALVTIDATGSDAREDANRSPTKNPSGCVRPSPHVEVAQGATLCCCKTLTGMCCNYVGFCGGAWVPGCLCSG